MSYGKDWGNQDLIFLSKLPHPVGDKYIMCQPLRRAAAGSYVFPAEAFGSAVYGLYNACTDPHGTCVATLRMAHDPEDQDDSADSEVELEITIRPNRYVFLPVPGAPRSISFQKFQWCYGLFR
jgi:hypothetical protein